MVALRFSCIVAVTWLSLLVGTLAAPLPMPSSGGSGNVSPTSEGFVPRDSKRNGSLFLDKKFIDPPPIPEDQKTQPVKVETAKVVTPQQAKVVQIPKPKDIEVDTAQKAKVVPKGQVTKLEISKGGKR